MRYAVFWGCYIPSRYPNIEAAVRLVSSRLGVDLEEMEGASCCPDPIVSKLVGREAWMALAVRNLSIAERMGLPLMTVCNGCFETLFEANREFNEDEEVRQEVLKLLETIGIEYGGKVPVKHFVEVVHEDVGLEKVSEEVSNPLKGLKAAIHYGCHLFRDNPEASPWRKPKMFKEIVEACGAEVVEYGLERLCCGYPLRQFDEELSLKTRLDVKLKAIEASGADCVVLVCPTCCIQFEMGQARLRSMGLVHRVPVVHLSELMALAFGIPSKEFGFTMHRSPVSQVLGRLGLK